MRNILTDVVRLWLQESVLKAGVRSSGACRSQTLYNLGLCLWQLTYDHAGLAQLQKADCVPPLVDLLKQGAHSLSSVVRILYASLFALSTLRNSLPLILLNSSSAAQLQCPTADTKLDRMRGINEHTRAPVKVTK